MKNTILVILLLLFTNLTFAQINENGDQLILADKFQSLSSSTMESTADLISIPAGDEIEGDYIGEMKFTPNGEEVWVLNRATDNISVIDWASQNIIQNIPVGKSPMDIDFSETLAVVACYESNEVYFINLADYTIAGVEAVSATPAKVDVSSIGNIAVIGCDEDDIAEVFDLNTLSLSLTISNFPIALNKFSFITSNPRSSIYFSNFRITEDEAFLINGKDESGLKFWNLLNGTVTATIPEAANSSQIELSVDGTKVIAVNNANPGLVTQIGIASQSFLKQVTLTDFTLYSTYSPPAVNTDGSKVFVAGYPDNTAWVDFETETWQQIPIGIAPDWVGRSTDGNYFIAGDYYLSVINAETGNVVSALNGISIQNGAVGAGNRIVASDPLRYESLVFYDFENPNNLSLIGESNTGSELEADATYAVKFTPDGKTLLAINSLSGTLSVIDVEAETLDAIIPLGSTETFQIDVTADGNYALVAKRLENKVSIIDLQSNEVVADISSGGIKPDQVFVLPGGEYAYVLNAGSNDNIGVIALDGANSSLQTTIDIGNTGVSWSNYGIRCDLKFSADGAFALLANAFDDQVQVINLSSHSVVGNIAVEGFPLQIAMSSEIDQLGFFAAITLKNSDEIAILAGNSNSWDLLGIYPCADAPDRITYDPVEEAFWVVSSSDGKTQKFSIVSLTFEAENTFLNRTPIATRYVESGRGFTLLRSDEAEIFAHQLQVTEAGDMQTYDLPSLPIHHFDVSSDGHLVGIAHPATDEVSILKETGVGFKEVVINLSKQPYLLFPNPTTEQLYFEKQEATPTYKSILFRLFDRDGELIWEENVIAGEVLLFARKKHWPDGGCFYELSTDGGKIQSGQVILH